jgi:3-methylfumaryl-CoA hydratase
MSPTDAVSGSAGAVDAGGANKWQQWVGQTESRTDQVTATPLAALAATLGRGDPAPREGDEVPPLWHWLYFLPLAGRGEIGPDGHPKRGGFLPPVPLPRRMFAGGRLSFRRPLRVGDVIRRDSRIASVTQKDGASGPLVFVTVTHEIGSAGDVAVVEEQDLVYRDAGSPGRAATPPGAPAAEATWSSRVIADEVMLFRYSALTFNGHRIHYDRPYATTVEGYPGLVVHGPLIATLLAELLRDSHPKAIVREFSFRAKRPLFDNAPFSVCGAASDNGSVKLWAVDADGNTAMDATATLEHHAGS